MAWSDPPPVAVKPKPHADGSMLPKSHDLASQHSEPMALVPHVN